MASPTGSKSKCFKSSSVRAHRNIPVGPPIAPVITSRVPLFQPTFKRLANVGAVTQETPWGSVTVEGRLGEIHRKVLDAIFADHLQSQRLDTGAHAFLIDPYRIERAANVAMNPKWLLGIFEDLRKAKVELWDKTTGLRHWAGILSEYHESPRARAEMPGGALSGDRPLYAVVVSAAWMRVFDTGLVMKYQALLPALNQIRDGATHAFALHILTHQAGSFTVDEVLAHIGAFKPELTDRRRRQIRQQVVDESVALSQLGIDLYQHPQTTRWMASYHPRPEVHFQNPSNPENR